MPHITLPCTLCGERTDWECASCRQPTCITCLRVWPSASGKGTRGYRCAACEAGVREPVRLARAALPVVTRVYYCVACRKEVYRHVGRRFTRSQQVGLADEEKVRLVFWQHRQATDCPGHGLGCELHYRYGEEP